MPTQVMNDSNSGNTEIKVKTAYNGEIMITYINENISYDELCNEIRGICRFSPDQVNTSPSLSLFIHRTGSVHSRSSQWIGSVAAGHVARNQ